jgi:hypothetical protein
VVVSFVVVELATRVKFFIETSWLLLALLFGLWGLAQISLALLVSRLFQRTRSALVFSYLLIIISVAAGEILNNSVYQKRWPNAAFWVYPVFSFYRAVYLIFSACTVRTPLYSATNTVLL